VTLLKDLKAAYRNAVDWGAFGPSHRPFKEDDTELVSFGYRKSADRVNVRRWQEAAGSSGVVGSIRAQTERGAGEDRA